MLRKFVLKHFSQVKSCLPSYRLEQILTVQRSSAAEGLRRGGYRTLTLRVRVGRRHCRQGRGLGFPDRYPASLPESAPSSQKLEGKMQSILSLRFTFA